MLVLIIDFIFDQNTRVTWSRPASHVLITARLTILQKIDTPARDWRHHEFGICAR